MINNFEASRRQTEKKEFSLIPEGVYQVSVHDIQDKEKPSFNDPAVLKKCFTFTFIVLNDGEFRGRRLWLDVNAIPPYPPYAGRKQSWMHKIVSAIEKHSITEDEANQFNTEKFNALVGKQLQVVVKHSTPKASGKVWPNIESVLAAQTELEQYAPPVPRTENLPEIQIDADDLPI